MSEPPGVRLDYDEAVYDVVESIPPGRVLAYGDIAELLGTFGPRRVALAMTRCPAGLPWHRVLRADGTPAPQLAVEQLTRLRAEGAPVRGDRVDLRRGRWAVPTSPPEPPSPPDRAG